MVKFLYFYRFKKNTLMKKLIFILLGMAVMASCSNSNTTSTIESTGTEQPVTGAMTPGEKQAFLLEALDGGTYTYVRLKEGNTEFWGAITARPLESDKKYFYRGSLWMRDFKSEALDRTFDSILFIEYFGEESMAESMQMTSPHGGTTAEDHTKTDQEAGLTIRHLEGEITLAELFANKNDYNGKQVTVRGDVVKILRDIMNRNWVHIQDGTSHEGMYDLTITLNDDFNFEPHDVVGFTGTITIDKDFGSGYFYPVIMEGAVVAKD